VKFGKYMQKLRRKRHLSIRQLSAFSGVSNAYISQVERGERGTPSPKILKKLAEPLGVTVKELLEAADYLQDNGNNRDCCPDFCREPDPIDSLPEEAKKTLEDFKHYIIEKYSKGN